MEKYLITIPELCEILQISESTFYRHIQKEMKPYELRIGRAVRYKAECVNELGGKNGNGFEQTV